MDVKKKMAIDALTSGANVRETALIAGVTRRTVYNWLEDSEFAFEIERRREESWHSQRARLLHFLPLAVQILEGALRGEETDRARLEASMWLLETSGCAANLKPELPNTGKLKEANGAWPESLLEAIKQEKARRAKQSEELA